jgi:retinal rod rhodopsin-sensitive cGMP 3',5'-cyclic phosphodiesterase subunit delta
MAQTALSGFSINSIKMKDAETGQLVWANSGQWNLHEPMVAHLPRTILQCSAVAREIVFSSQRAISDFHLKQKILLHGQVIEEWVFHFGFVIPNSTNTWEQTISAEKPENMIAPEVLSGNIVIETLFYDGSSLIHRSEVTLFYD